MNYSQLRHLKYLYKTLGDDTRMLMFGHLCQGERNVTELATLTGKQEATISHHLSKLRAVGLLNLRTDGNQRYYRIDPRGLQWLKSWTNDIENMPLEVDTSKPDTSWVENYELDEQDKKVLKDYAPEGRLMQIPSKQKKLLAVLNWIICAFEADRTYTEKEVNEILKRFHDDFASLRRDLIDFRYLDREKAGNTYWVVQHDD